MVRATCTQPLLRPGTADPSRQLFPAGSWDGMGEAGGWDGEARQRVVEPAQVLVPLLHQAGVDAWGVRQPSGSPAGATGPCFRRAA